MPFCICAVAALSINLTAQATTTIPSGYDKLEGEGAFSIPLLYAPARLQSGYGPKAIPWATTKTIKELWVRADRVSSLKTGFSLTLQVKISSKGCDAATRSSVFAKNHGTDLKTFMAKKAYNFQPFAKGKSFPNAWLVQIKGDAPFIAAARKLVVDWASYTPANVGRSYFSMYLDASQPRGMRSGSSGASARYGRSCNPPGFTNRSRGLNVDEVFYTEGFTSNKGDLVLAWLGASRISMAIPGLKGCTLYTAPVIVHPSLVKTPMTSTYGYARFVWGRVPAFMNGKSASSQLAAADSTLQTMRFSHGGGVSFGNLKVSYARLISYRYGWAAYLGAFDPDKDDAHGGGLGAALVYDVR